MVRWDTGNGASLPSDKFPGTLAQEMQKAINLCMLESMLGHRYLHCRSWWFCGCWGVLCRGSVCPCDKSPMRTLRHSSTYFLPVWHTVGTCCAGVSGISCFFFFLIKAPTKCGICRMSGLLSCFFGRCKLLIWKRVCFCVPWVVQKGKLEPRKEQGPSCLARVKPFVTLHVLQVLVVCVNDRCSTPFNQQCHSSIRIQQIRFLKCKIHTSLIP